MEQSVAQLVGLGGRYADPEQARLRFAQCQACDQARADFSVAGVVVPGGRGVTQCHPCGCIAAAKARVARYFSVTKLRVVPSECPHPDGSRWAAIDQNYTP